MFQEGLGRWDGICDDREKNGKRFGFGCGKFPEVSFKIEKQ